MAAPNSTTYASDVFTVDEDKSGYRRNTNPVLINRAIKPVKPPTDVPLPDTIGCAGATDGITIDLTMYRGETGHTLIIRDLDATYGDGSILRLSGYQVTGDSLANNLSNSFSGSEYHGKFFFVDQSSVEYNDDNFTLNGAVTIRTHDRNMRIGIELIRMDEGVDASLAALNVISPSTSTYMWKTNDASTATYMLEACLNAEGWAYVRVLADDERYWAQDFYKFKVKVDGVDYGIRQISLWNSPSEVELDERIGPDIVLYGYSEQPNSGAGFYNLGSVPHTVEVIYLTEGEVEDSAWLYRPDPSVLIQPPHTTLVHTPTGFSVTLSPYDEYKYQYTWDYVVLE